MNGWVDCPYSSNRQNELSLFLQYMKTLHQKMVEQDEDNINAKLISHCIKQFPDDDKTWFRNDELAALTGLSDTDVYNAAKYKFFGIITDFNGGTAWHTVSEYKNTVFSPDENSADILVKFAAANNPDNKPPAVSLPLISFVNDLAEAAIRTEAISQETQRLTSFNRVGEFVTQLRRVFQRRTDKSALESKICSALTVSSIWEDVLVLKPMVSINICGWHNGGTVIVNKDRVDFWCKAALSDDNKITTAVDFAEIKRSIAEMSLAVEESKRINSKAEIMFNKLANALEKCNV